MTKQILFKILTVGDANVGKTTLLQRYVEGLFKEECLIMLNSKDILPNF